MTIKRGDVYLASLDPTMGKEIAKTRPVVVVSNDIGNKYAGTVTVVPIKILLVNFCVSLTKTAVKSWTKMDDDRGQ